MLLSSISSGTCSAQCKEVRGESNWANLCKSLHILAFLTWVQLIKKLSWYFLRATSIIFCYFFPFYSKVTADEEYLFKNYFIRLASAFCKDGEWYSITPLKYNCDAETLQETHTQIQKKKKQTHKDKKTPAKRGLSIRSCPSVSHLVKCVLLIASKV